MAPFVMPSLRLHNCGEQFRFPFVVVIVVVLIIQSFNCKYGLDDNESLADGMPSANSVIHIATQHFHLPCLFMTFIYFFYFFLRFVFLLFFIVFFPFFF